jgi:hypothetical protein
VEIENDKDSDDLLFTRNVMASSQLTTDGYSVSQKTVYEKGDIVELKKDFLANLKALQQELGIVGDIR